MRLRAKALLPAVIGVVAVATGLVAQQSADTTTPAPRALGAVVGRAVRTFERVARVIPMSGSVFVHDAGGRQLWMLDSSLAGARMVLDSAEGALRRFRGDSALFHPIDGATGSPAVRAFILTAQGAMARMAMVPQRDHVGCDVADMDNTGWQTCDAPTKTDSSVIMAVHFAKWDVDTIGRVASVRRDTAAWPVIARADAWALFRDGTLAIARSDDYYIELVTPQGGFTRGPRAPFGWRRITDADRDRLLDSARRADVSGPRQYAPADAWPSHWPPFSDRGVRTMLVDEDDRIWVDERQPPGADTVSVYGIFDRNGRFLERVKVPAAHTVAGFGADGVVYLTVAEGGRTALLVARFR